MASSSSDFSNSSTESETSQEMTPEFDYKATYEACAPLHWDAEEWDFLAWSEDDESLTDGEDLQFLLDRELEDEDDNDDVSWAGTTPRKRRMTMSRPRRTRRQGVSCVPGRLTKAMTEMTAGTPTTELTAMMAPPVMTVPETMAVIAATTMTMATSTRFLQSSVVDSQAPTGGSVSVDVSSR
jgi:hypothetical protein